MHCFAIRYLKKKKKRLKEIRNYLQYDTNAAKNNTNQYCSTICLQIDIIYD